MGKLEKGSRPLNETELNDIHGGSYTTPTPPTMVWAAFCKAKGCGWESEWFTSYDEAKMAGLNHERESRSPEHSIDLRQEIRG